MPSWVYAITEKQTTEFIYIGSTTGKYFCIRKGGHTRPSTTNSGKQKQLYGYIIEKGGWINFQFDIIFHSEINIENAELRNKEKKFIQKYTPKCNKHSPIATKEEHNARKRREQKEWRKNNPEYLIKHKARQSQKDYTKKRCSTKINCPCGGMYTLQNKTNHFSRIIHKNYEDSQNKIENIKEISYTI